MAKRTRMLKGAPEFHAERVAEIHGQIEQGLREVERWMTERPARPSIAQTTNGCRIFFDNVRALGDRIGRAQGHLDGVAGTPAATTAMFQTQKRLARRVGSMGTKFKRACMKGV